MRIRQAHRVIPPDPSTQLLLMHDIHGYNAHSLIAIASGVRLWSCRETEGAIGFNEFGKVWLVPGEPLASAHGQAALADRFLQAARAEGRTVGFLPVTERFAKHSSELGLRAIKIGAAPYFDLATWAPRGDRAKKVRAGMNQAFRAGIRVTKVTDIDEALKKETECLWKSWLTTRRSPTRFGWLFAVDLFRNSERKRYFTARDPAGKLVGFLGASPIPARQGWYLEDVLRLPDAPNGTTDLLIVEALKSLKHDGAKLETLGTAPMAMEGSVASSVHCSRRLSQMTRLLASLCPIFYNFDGVRHFKAKFAPSWWESEYALMSPNFTAPPRVFSAVIQAVVPAGPSYLIARQVSRAWRRLKAKKEPTTSANIVSVIECKGRNES
jgi:phosphatidylglycerol lysyltransferase